MSQDRPLRRQEGDNIDRVAPKPGIVCIPYWRTAAISWISDMGQRLILTNKLICAKRFKLVVSFACPSALIHLTAWWIGNPTKIAR